MGRLILVRHAQASFLSPNYDQLSLLGQTQARLLGEYWARRRMTFDRVYCGPAVRHRQTTEGVAGYYRESGLPFAEPAPAPEFDEFPGEAVLAASLPQLCKSRDHVRALSHAFERSQNDLEKRLHFQRLFEAVISAWINGEVAVPNVESWQQFCKRVNRGLSALLDGGTKGEVVLIFTSGGPIGVAVQRALHLSAQYTLQVSWMSRNCSLTEFLFSRERFTLSSFNAFPHLGEEALLTYR